MTTRKTHAAPAGSKLERLAAFACVEEVFTEAKLESAARAAGSVDIRDPEAFH